MSGTKYYINKIEEYKELVMLVTVFGWVNGIVRYHINYNPLYLVLLHISSTLLIVSSFFWIKTYFRRIRNRTLSTTQGLGLGESSFFRMFKAGLALNIIVFTPIVIFTNWLPYSSIDRARNWDDIIVQACDQVECSKVIGMSYETDFISGLSNDSTATRKYKLQGSIGTGTLTITVNESDSILTSVLEDR